MALNFPISPSDGDIFLDTATGNRYVYKSAYSSWVSVSNTTLTSSNTQVLFASDNAITGSNGLIFTANTLYVANVNTSLNVVAQYYFGNGSFLTGVSPPVDLSAANNWSNTLYSSALVASNTSANSANAYTVTVGEAANNYAKSSFYTIANGTAAFAKANDAYNLANDAYNYANTIIDTANNTVIFNHANSAFDKANAANVLAYNTGIGANAHADSVGLSANLYSDSVGLAGNNYSIQIGAASNTWANTKLANTNNVWFDGSLNISQDLLINRNLINVTQLVFNTGTNIVPTQPGALTWSQDDATLRFDMDTPSNVIQHIGQDLFYLVKNQTGSTINKGTVVRFAGTLGASGRLLIAPARANNQYPSKYIMGVTAANITDGSDGFVLAQGKLKQIDTSMFSAGDILYVSSSTPGAFQNTMPSAPNNKITIAAVVHSDAISGSLEIRVTLGSKINEDELAEISGLANGDVLVYNSTTGRFENNPQSSLNVDKVDGFHASDLLTSANNSANAANDYAVTVGTAGNNYSIQVGAASNTWTNTQYTNALVSANNSANASNNYASDTYYAKTGGTISGDVTVTGNLTVSGETTYTNTNTLLVGDNIITLNADIPDYVAPTENAGLEVNRGSANANSAIFWNETTDKWQISSNIQLGSTYVNIASNTDLENMTAAGNNYSVQIGAASNNYANASFYTIANGTAAFNQANGAYVNANAAANSANAYTVTVGTAGNTYAMVYANGVANSANAYAVTVGEAANNYAAATYAVKNNTTLTGTIDMASANIKSQTLTDGASIAWDISSGTIATVTLGGNRALANATNLKVGTFILHIIQDGVGGRTLSYGSQYKWPAGVAPVLTTTASAHDVLSFVCDGTYLYGSFLPDVK